MVGYTGVVQYVYTVCIYSNRMVGYTGVVQYVYTVCIYIQYVYIYTVCIYIQYVYIYSMYIYIYNVFGLRIKTISPLVSSALCIPQVWFLFSPLVPSLLL